MKASMQERNSEKRARRAGHAARKNGFLERFFGTNLGKIQGEDETMLYFGAYEAAAAEIESAW